MESSDTVRAGRAAWATLVVTTIGMFATFGGASAVLVAIPVVSQDLEADPLAVQWVVLSYLLIMSVGIPVWARVADLADRRTLYLLGLGLVSVSSVACAMAPSVELLILFRCIQAVGAAAIIANAIALLADAFPRRLLGLALGLNVASASAATALGPLLGGLIVDAAGWRGVFFVSGVFGALGVLVGLLTLRRRSHAPSPQSFDLWGAALIVLSLGALVIGTSLHMWWLLPASLLLGAVFIVVERRSASPLIDLRIMTSKYIALALAATAALTGLIQALSVILAVALQNEFGFSALDAGSVLAPMSLGLMVMAPVSGLAGVRLSVRALSSVGMLVCLLAVAGLILTVQFGASPIGVSVCTFGIGVGAGLFQSPNTAALVSGVEPSRRGTANGLRATVQNTAAVLVSALVLGLNAAGIDLGLILLILLPLAVIGLVASMARGTAPTNPVRV